MTADVFNVSKGSLPLVITDYWLNIFLAAKKVMITRKMMTTIKMMTYW